MMEAQGWAVRKGGRCVDDIMEAGLHVGMGEGVDDAEKAVVVLCRSN